MKWLWPGWLLCALTAGLFSYIYCVVWPAISVLLGGMNLPDGQVLGVDAEGARALFAAFLSDHASAQAAARTSASEAYLSFHAGYDLVFPPLLAASVGFLAYAALFRPAQIFQTPRIVGVGFGLVLALAFTYLACDFVENAVADSMFGPNALKLSFNEPFVFVLQVLTRGKFASLVIASGLIATLWVWRLKTARLAKQPLAES